MSGRILAFDERFAVDEQGVARQRSGVVEAEARDAALATIPPGYAGCTLASWRGAWPLRADLEHWPVTANEGPSAPWAVLFLGSVGTGKTHAATALFREAVARTAGGAWLDVSDALEAMRAAIDTGGRSPVEAALARPGVLLLDDLGAERATDWTREVLGRTLRHRHAHRKPTICTTNASSVADLAQALEPRLISRLAEGEIVRLVGLDRRLEP